MHYVNWEKKGYEKIPVREQVEVAALIGDVADDPKGKPNSHIHIVLGTRDDNVKAGHLGEGHVRPTVEVIVTQKVPRTCARSRTTRLVLLSFGLPHKRKI